MPALADLGRSFLFHLSAPEPCDSYGHRRPRFDRPVCRRWRSETSRWRELGCSHHGRCAERGSARDALDRAACMLAVQARR